MKDNFCSLTKFLKKNSTQTSSNCIITSSAYVPEEESTYKICRKLGLQYEKPLHNETSYDTKKKGVPEIHTKLKSN